MKNYPISKRLTFFLMLIFGVNHIGYTQNKATTDSLLNTAKALFESAEEKKALQDYQRVLSSDEDNYEALWHTALLYARIGYRKAGEDQKLRYYEESLKYAENMIQLYPESGYSHFVYAVANGRISDVSDSQTRIEKSHIVKEHAKKAVELLPDYAPTWHVLGLWHSKVANVGSAQQFAAGIFSEGIPDGASNEKAVAYIQKAIDLQPSQSIRYMLDLGRHYMRAGNNQKATETLKKVLQMEPVNKIDTWNLERAQELMKELE